MTALLADKLCGLLDASLAAWRIAGKARRDEAGAIIVNAAGKSIRIAAAAPGTPFRWTVTTPDRTRGAASVVGVLRAVRSAIDPQYSPMRLRVAPSSAEAT